jgi:Protein of unknown function (DUF1254)
MDCRLVPAILASALALLTQAGLAQTSPASPASVRVTADNFVRAESDLYFAAIVQKGGFGRFFHDREPARLDAQTVIRMNRDTLYSGAVFDLDAGPVTITLPDAGSRFVSLQVSGNCVPRFVVSRDGLRQEGEGSGEQREASHFDRARRPEVR